jgi:N-acetyl-anhydromuramyl-L-alanine amidase AmpD
MSLPTKWVGCHPTNYSKTRLRGGRLFKPEAIVVHVMEGSLVGTDAHFATARPGKESSAHYGIGTPWKQPGKLEIHQYVQDEDISFHAGVVAKPTWKRYDSTINPNWNTIGIEHEGTALSRWSDAMYDASASLIRQLCSKWRIPVDRDHIVGHREIYAVKSCPGQCDLDRLVQLVSISREP